MTGVASSPPEYKADNLCGVGLYTSDELSETQIPVGMGSKEELTKTLQQLTEVFKDTTAKLWKRLAGYHREQLMDAGALTYYNIIKDFAHVAGCYEADDWNKIDERADRFRPLLNDEYGNQILGALFVPLSCPSHQVTPYVMMQHSNLPKRTYSPLSAAATFDDECVPSVGDRIHPGVTYLPEKVDKYRTTRGHDPEGAQSELQEVSAPK